MLVYMSCKDLDANHYPMQIRLQIRQLYLFRCTFLYIYNYILFHFSDLYALLNSTKGVSRKLFESCNHLFGLYDSLMSSNLVILEVSFRKTIIKTIKALMSNNDDNILKYKQIIHIFNTPCIFTVISYLLISTGNIHLII